MPKPTATPEVERIAAVELSAHSLTITTTSGTVHTAAGTGHRIPQMTQMAMDAMAAQLPIKATLDQAGSMVALAVYAASPR